MIQVCPLFCNYSILSQEGAACFKIPFAFCLLRQARIFIETRKLHVFRCVQELHCDPRRNTWLCQSARSLKIDGFQMISVEWKEKRLENTPEMNYSFKGSRVTCQKPLESWIYPKWALENRIATAGEEVGWDGEDGPWDGVKLKRSPHPIGGFLWGNRQTRWCDVSCVDPLGSEYVQGMMMFQLSMLAFLGNNRSKSNVLQSLTTFKWWDDMRGPHGLNATRDVFTCHIGEGSKEGFPKRTPRLGKKKLFFFLPNSVCIFVPIGFMSMFFDVLCFWTQVDSFMWGL